MLVALHSLEKELEETLRAQVSHLIASTTASVDDEDVAVVEARMATGG